MTKDIIRKLTVELNKGITTELQVVYLLAGIRKLIERDESEEQYSTLRFHCDWALHSKLDRAAAKAVLRWFDEAQPLLKQNIRLRELPSRLRHEILRISKMESFEKELTRFWGAYSLPSLMQHRSDGWPYFLHLYTQVIEDIPLVVKEGPPPQKIKKKQKALPAPQNIRKVTVHFECAKETIKDDSGWEDLPIR